VAWLSSSLYLSSQTSCACRPSTRLLSAGQPSTKFFALQHAQVHLFSCYQQALPQASYKLVFKHWFKCVAAAHQALQGALSTCRSCDFPSGLPAIVWPVSAVSKVLCLTEHTETCTVLCCIFDSLGIPCMHGCSNKAVSRKHLEHRES